MVSILTGPLRPVLQLVVLLTDWDLWFQSSPAR